MVSELRDLWQSEDLLALRLILGLALSLQNVYLDYRSAEARLQHLLRCHLASREDFGCRKW